MIQIMQKSIDLRIFALTKVLTLKNMAFARFNFEATVVAYFPV